MKLRPGEARNIIILDIILVLMVWMSLFVITSTALHLQKPDEQYQDFSSALLVRQQLLEEKVNVLLEKIKVKNYDHLFGFGYKPYEDLYTQEGQSLFIYDKDSLQYWTDNHVPVENYLLTVCLDNRVVQLNNGWYLVVRKQWKSKDIIGLQLIKQDYPIHNQYLEDSFFRSFDLHESSKIQNVPEIGFTAVYDAQKNPLLWLKVEQSLPEVFWWVISIGLTIVFFALLFRISNNLFRFASSASSPLFAFFLVSGILLSIRYYLTYFKFPDFLHETDLFSPALYAYSGMLPSLGDLLIFSIIFYYCSGLLVSAFRRTFRLMPSQRDYFFRSLLLQVLLLISIFSVWVQFNISSSLIRDSRISIDTQNLLTFNQYSFFGLLVVVFLGLGFFKIISLLSEFYRKVKLSDTLIHSTLAIVIFSISFYFLNKNGKAIDLALIIGYFIIIWGLEGFKAFGQPLLKDGLRIIVLSLFTGFLFNAEKDFLDQQHSKVLTESLSQDRDPVAEFLFKELKKKLVSDTLLINKIDPFKNDNPKFVTSLVEDYFTGFWEKYDVQVFVFDSLCLPIAKSINAESDRYDFFETLFEESSAVGLRDFKYFPLSNSIKSAIAAKVPLTRTIKGFGKIEMTLIIEFRARFLSDEIGFPALLLDDDLHSGLRYPEYSWAIYKNKRLVKHYGKFTYSINPVELIAIRDVEGSDAFSWKEYHHHLTKGIGSNLFFVSHPEPGWLLSISGYTLLFAILGLFNIIIITLSGRYIFKGWLSFSLRGKIQLIPVMVVLLSLLIVVFATVYFLNKQYEEKNADNLNERLQSVLMELENKFGTLDKISLQQRSLLNYYAGKFSNIFYTDINFYDPEGNILASSRPQMQEKGLLSGKMNPKAYSQVAIEKDFRFVNSEKIGNMVYLSAYAPFYNEEDQLLGYLNLPYFSKQNELEAEISTVVVALLNIYILLIVLSVLVTYLISNRITHPLTLLQAKLSRVELGRKNEMLEWKDNDEIGGLIAQYNRMILELGESAQRLAESERESAWREMAKQVAHEIKNPLTPIKLQVQMLDRAFNENPEQFELRYRQFSRMLIEQIETLNNIATEFSRFGIMPKPQFEKVNLFKVLEDAVHLFRNSSQAEISLTAEMGISTIVNGDKEQLLRVFNNLLKNALQAIPEERRGWIRVTINEVNGKLKVLVRDNGIGISESERRMIFVPNFTTKSGGMGLGLSMVKSILETMGASISFESILEEGTVFRIDFPLPTSDG
jgi:two-component system, NtrC family, nitrogen regulation sensor histidine kinase NtrY